MSASFTGGVVKMDSMLGSTATRACGGPIDTARGPCCSGQPWPLRHRQALDRRLRGAARHRLPRPRDRPAVRAARGPAGHRDAFGAMGAAAGLDRLDRAALRACGAELRRHGGLEPAHRCGDGRGAADAAARVRGHAAGAGAGRPLTSLDASSTACGGAPWRLVGVLVDELAAGERPSLHLPMPQDKRMAAMASALADDPALADTIDGGPIASAWRAARSRAALPWRRA
jgi:hypothetical protein